ncbi:hypothetical protein GEV33_007694 [Tenebrio molitor]|uniref:Uncharacterized protein n=1 Tax=Tenebrio molitor TaxID=7067 RepID=A0A8J6HIR6_TENMO|nr:hypothetical protein GEV33_007694 [Tenebrio molitor]
MLKMKNLIARGRLKSASGFLAVNYAPQDEFFTPIIKLSRLWTHTFHYSECAEQTTPNLITIIGGRSKIGKFEAERKIATLSVLNVIAEEKKDPVRRSELAHKIKSRRRRLQVSGVVLSRKKDNKTKLVKRTNKEACERICWPLPNEFYTYLTLNGRRRREDEAGGVPCSIMFEKLFRIHLTWRSHDKKLSSFRMESETFSIGIDLGEVDLPPKQ